MFLWTIPGEDLVSSLFAPFLLLQDARSFLMIRFIFLLMIDSTHFVSFIFFFLFTLWGATRAPLATRYYARWWSQYGAVAAKGGAVPKDTGDTGRACWWQDVWWTFGYCNMCGVFSVFIFELELLWFVSVFAGDLFVPLETLTIELKHVWRATKCRWWRSKCSRGSGKAHLPPKWPSLGPVWAWYGRFDWTGSTAESSGVWQGCP